MKLTPELRNEALALYLKGLPLFAVSKELGVDRVTLWRAAKADADFCNALKERRELFAEEVETIAMQWNRGQLDVTPGKEPRSAAVLIFTMKRLMPEVYGDKIANNLGSMSIKQLFDAVKDE